MVDDVEQGHEARCLRRHGEECGHRGRRSLVGVGRPFVERHRGDLEPEPDDHEDQGDRDRRTGRLRRQCPAHKVEAGRTREPVEQRHAVQQDGRSEDAHQVVLEAGLVRELVTLAPGREHVSRDREQLESDEDRDEVAGRCHDAHAEDRAQEEHVVLRLPVVALGDVVRRQQHDDVPTDDEERLEQQSGAVDDVGAAEERPGGVVRGREGEQRDGRGEQDQSRDRRDEGLGPLEQHDVGEQQHDDARGDHDLGRDRVPVDRGLGPRLSGEQDGQHVLSPRRPWRPRAR